MKVEYLKYVRVGVSLLFFVATGLLFLDFTNAIPPAITGGIVFLQFLPSLIKLLTLVGVAAGGCIAVILLTLLFGRVYCSTICPFGTLQDMFSFVARKVQRRKWHRYTEPMNWLRYAILSVTVILFVAGIGAAVNLLDPFSNFGRIFGNLFRPALMGTNNAAAYILDQMHLYLLYRAPVLGTTWISLLVAVGVLVFVGWMAYSRGRLYCNTVCPVGSFLGLLSRYSLVRVSIKASECISCGLCERVCKAECIDKTRMTVDMSRCVGCFNCFSACPTDGMKLGPIRALTPKPRPIDPDYLRRDIILGAFLFLAGTRTALGQEKKVVATKATTIPEKKTSPVSPPGSRSVEHFTDTCTACHLCVAACPSHVLAPSAMEYGLLGILQPHMDYSSGYCNYDCIKCGEVCPSGAILPLAVESKKLTQLGTAKFIKESCVVFTEETDCGACSEHCPTKAVNMVPYKGALVIPEVKAEYCVGCGACEHACPTRPYRAIYVDGNPIHAVAKKPEVKKLEQKVDMKEDFPF